MSDLHDLGREEMGRMTLEDLQSDVRSWHSRQERADRYEKALRALRGIFEQVGDATTTDELWKQAETITRAALEGESR